MTDRDRAVESGADMTVTARVLRTEGLFAEYTTGQRPTGEWFALGTVRSELPLRLSPAWVIVGTGDTPEAAVSQLQGVLESEARRLALVN
jgi:hypothetical protein